MGVIEARRPALGGGGGATSGRGPAPAGVERSDTRPHAVVIGAGFGGLAAAVRLGAKGYRVTVLERLDAPGGRAYAFRQDGFVFDAGPTIVTAPNLFEELWGLCGRDLAEDVTLVPMDPFYRIRFHDGAHFDYCGDAERMRAEVARFSPGDVDGYDRFMRETEEVFRIGFEELGHVPFARFSDMLRVLPDLVRLGGHRSVYGMVAKYIRDERLRTVFSFHPLLIGGNPFMVSSVYTLINHLERKWGVHFAMGGTNALVRGLGGLIAGQGNRIRCNVTVERILLQGSRATGVRLEGGEEIAADLVVSNADTAWTYAKLLPPGAKRRWSPHKVERARYSNGLFVWYFGTDRRYEDVLHHTIALGPRYRGLIRDIFGRKVLSDDFSLYLHRPTATDRSMAPEGCDAFYALAPVPHLDADIDWTAAAEPFRRRVQAELERTLLPGLGDALVTQRLLTPADFETRLLSVKGAGFGMEPVLWQSAWFRPHNASEDIERLYIVGAGTHPGAGLPGVLSSAKIMDSLVPDAAALA
jgi:phytoene desaturase